jgi:hypothetical protein
MVKPIFLSCLKKWLWDFKMDKMVKRGKLSIHLQKASKLSKEWGEGQSTNKLMEKLLSGKREIVSPGVAKL